MDRKYAKNRFYWDMLHLIAEWRKNVSLAERFIGLFLRHQGSWFGRCSGSGLLNVWETFGNLKCLTFSSSFSWHGGFYLVINSGLTRWLTPTLLHSNWKLLLVPCKMKRFIAVQWGALTSEVNASLWPGNQKTQLELFSLTAEFLHSHQENGHVAIWTEREITPPKNFYFVLFSSVLSLNVI